MKHSERFALSQWLSSYPQDLTFDQVIDLIRDEDERVSVWELIEGHGSSAVINQIDNTLRALESMMDDLVYGVCLSDKTEEQSKAEGVME